MTTKASSMRQRVSTWQLALVTELTLELPDDRIDLRVEVFRSGSDRRTFKAGIWRLESYRLQATFPQRRGKPAHQPSDELILKDFEGFESAYSAPQRGRNARAVERTIVGELRNWRHSSLEARVRPPTSRAPQSTTAG